MADGDEVDIGHGCTIKYIQYNGQRAGLIWEHPNNRNPSDRCNGGFVSFKGRYMDSEGWTLESENPLTLSPSLLCRACGAHGFIREGKWVPC